MSFTPEELAAMAEADAQIEAEFELTYEEVQLSRELDAYAVWQRSSWAEIEKRETSKKNRARSYCQNSESKKQYQREYYRQNLEACIARKKAWYLENRASVLAQQKAYKKSLKKEN